MIFWMHLVAGLSAGVVILLMCVTGVLLTYERQMIAWSDSHFRSAPPAPDAARLPIDQLLDRVTQQRPDARPTALTIGSAHEASVTITAGQQTLFVDAYSGAVLGEGSQRMRRFMSSLRAWHRWLAVEGEGRPIARAITGWSNLIFLFIVVSGIYIWFPQMILFFRNKLRGKARDFNWHNVTGVWCAVVLFVVVLGALPISFPWANALVYRAVGETPPAPAAARPQQPAGSAPAKPAAASLPLGELIARAASQEADWRTINLRLPAAADSRAVFAIDRGTGGQPQWRSTLTLDRASASVISYETFEDQSLGRRLRSILRFAHTGEVLGIPGQTVAGIASAGGALLVYTGFALAWRRFRAWRQRRARANVVVTG